MKKIIENLLIANMVKYIETGIAADIPAALYDLKCGEFIDTVDDLKRYMYKSVDVFVDTFIAGNRHDLVDILNGKKVNGVSITDDRDLYQLCHISNFMDCMANPISVNEMIDLMKRSGLNTHMLNEIFDYWSDLTNNERLTGTETRALRQLPSVMTNGMTPSQLGALPRLAYIFHNGEIFDDPAIAVKVCEDINKLGPSINWQQNKMFLTASEEDKDKIRSIVAEIVNK
jgi:hypothetical protein